MAGLTTQKRIGAMAPHEIAGHFANVVLGMHQRVQIMKAQHEQGLDVGPILTQLEFDMQKLLESARAHAANIAPSPVPPTE